MADGARLTTVETVRRNRSWLFTVENRYGDDEEVILVECEDGDAAVRAWVNSCTHEAQRLDRGYGAAVRDGEIVCPKHGSMFDSCSGDCDNGEAAGTTLVSVDVECEDGDVYLTDEERTFRHEGGVDEGDDGDDMPGSSSHIGF